jgi:hypothetical protein
MLKHGLFRLTLNPDYSYNRLYFEIIFYVINLERS